MLIIGFKGHTSVVPIFRISAARPEPVHFQAVEMLVGGAEWLARERHHVTEKSSGPLRAARHD